MRYLIRNILLLTVCLTFNWSILQAQADSDKKFTVILDAGHGGKDVGATDNGVMEKNINLKVARQLESLIKKKMKNTNVVMTRDEDKYLTLQERADLANKSQGDLFISIHTNSVSKKNKNRKSLAGSSVYTLGLHKDEDNLDVAMRENSVIELESDYQQKYSGFDPQRDESYIIFEMAQKKNLSQSIKFAENLETELTKAGRKNRGVHQAGFWVLWATSMPSVLIELDFICNPESAKYLASDKGSKELAEAIFKAIQKYENNWNKSRNNNIREERAEIENPAEEKIEKETSSSYTLISETPASKAKIRTHKPIEVNNTATRKRRSAVSRQLSLATVYEYDKLEYTTPKIFSTELIEEGNKEELLALNQQVAAQDKKGKDKKKAEKKPKEKKQKQPKQRKSDAHSAKVNKLVTVYKIQIHASSDLLSQGNSLFCGLAPISTYKENNLYKYFYGESTDRSELEEVLADIREKIPDAFIVSSTKSIQSK